MLGESFVVKHRLVKASCVPNRWHWESTFCYGLCLPGLCVACWHGWWDTESSHFLSWFLGVTFEHLGSLVLLFKLTPVSKLQSSCTLQLLSTQDRNTWGAHPFLKTPGTLLQVRTEYLDVGESLLYTRAIRTPRVCVSKSFLQTEVRGHQEWTKPSMLGEWVGCIKGIFSQVHWTHLTKWWSYT